MSSKGKCIGILLGLFLTCPVICPSAMGADVKIPKLDLHETKLENGLRVIIVPDHSAPVYAICVTYNVGSRNEQPGHTGFAHLFEHMMFEGSHRVGKGEMDELIFGSGGTMNGSTNEDRTNYYEELPKNELDLGLFLESDRMRSLNITQTNFENQRRTVEEERRERDDNQAYGRTGLELDNLSYDNFAYKHSTIGSIADLNAATVNEVSEFFRIYYAPNNAVLTLVGDFDPAEVLAKVKKYFASIPAHSPPPKVDLVESSHDGERRETIYDPLARLPQIDLAYHIPPGNTAGSYAAQELALILGRGESSRLYQHLVKDEQLASKVTVASEARMGTSQFYITVTPRSGVKVEDLEQGIDREIDAVSQNGVTPEELARAKTQLLRGAIEQRRSVYSTARLIGQYAVYFGDANLVNTVFEKQDAVTLDEVHEVAKTYMVSGERTMIVTLPGGPARASASGAKSEGPSNAAGSKLVRLGLAPVSKDVLRVKLPRPLVQTLPNGLKILFLEDHKLPTVAFRLWIRPGELADPTELPGLASFTAAMLREGTARRSSSEIAAEADSLGMSLSAAGNFGASYTAIGAAGLAPDSARILDLLSDVVLDPAFSPEEVAKYKQRAEAGLELDMASPSVLAQKALRHALYGNTPMAVTLATRESIERFTPADMKHFHDEHYRPGNTLLAVTGDFDTGEMKALVTKYFGEWKGEAEPATAFSATPDAGSARITVVDRPGSVQTYLLGGDRAIARTDPEYYALEVMNQILGDGPESRLHADLREEHGYTYGAYSHIHADIYPGDWYAYSSVRTPVTEGAMEQFRFELKKIAAEPVGPGELGEAHRAIVGSFALSLTDPGVLLDDWLAVEHFQLPMDYWDSYPGEIQKVDPVAVKAVAGKYADANRIQWIAVGDAAQIKDGLAKFGPVRVVDASGNAAP
jgi:zinc protease